MSAVEQAYMIPNSNPQRIRIPTVHKMLRFVASPTDLTRVISLQLVGPAGASCSPSRGPGASLPARQRDLVRSTQRHCAPSPHLHLADPPTISLLACMSFFPSRCASFLSPNSPQAWFSRFSLKTCDWTQSCSCVHKYTILHRPLGDFEAEADEVHRGVHWASLGAPGMPPRKVHDKPRKSTRRAAAFT